MKIDKCKLLGHKWIPVFIKGEYSGEMIEFISCFCDRCRKGHDEIYDIVKVGKKREFNTYNEKWYKKDKV